MSQKGASKVGGALFGIVVASVLAVITLQAGVSGLETVYKVPQINDRAETTTGTVTDTGIGSSWHWDDGEKVYDYEPKITYHYTVDGRRYNSTDLYDQIDDRPTFREKSDARAALPDGQNVTVYYLPSDPSRSFLVKPSINWFASLGIGGLMTMIGLFLLYVVYALVMTVADTLGVTDRLTN